YGFFNLLTIVLCVLLLDDSFLSRWLPARLVERLAEGTRAQGRASRFARAGKVITVALAVVILTISGSEMLLTLEQQSVVPNFALQLVNWQSPFMLVNSYGLFRVMTTSRIEIVVEGSNDGQTWQAY